MKTDPKRLSDIKKIYEAGAATFLERTSDTSIANNGWDVVEIREKFLTYIPENSLILDIGCGTGRDAKYFIEHGHRVVGIDICEPFILELQKTTPGEYSIGDIVDGDSLVYKREYDALWSNTSLVHLSRWEAKQVMQNCFRALKKWGCFFVGTKYSDTSTHIEEKESKSIPGTVKPYLYYTESDLKSDAEETGFEVLETSIGQWAYWWDQFIRLYAKK